MPAIVASRQSKLWPPSENLTNTALGWTQWRCQLWDTGARAPSTSNNFIFSSLWSKSDSQLSNYCEVCEISRCRYQQLKLFRSVLH